MVCLKVLVFAAVVCAVASSPTVPLPLVKDGLGVIGKAIQGADTSNKGQNPLAPFGILAQGVTDLAGNAADIFKDVVKFRFPATFDDSINAVISVARAAAGIVNVVIPGLGTILGSMIIAVAKIFICVLGSPGYLGFLFNDRRGGYGNSADIPAVCQKDYGKNMGCKPYTGKYKSPSDVIDFYDLGNCNSQINDLINKATNGKGIDGLSASDRIIVELILKISVMLSSNNSCKFTKKDIQTVMIDVTIIIGVIGNGYNDGYGSNLIESLLNYVGSSFKSKGLDLSSHLDEIKQKIEKCGRYNFGGALKDNSNGNNGDNDSCDNSQDSSNNNQNTQDENNDDCDDDDSSSRASSSSFAEAGANAIKNYASSSSDSSASSQSGNKNKDESGTNDDC